MQRWNVGHPVSVEIDLDARQSLEDQLGIEFLAPTNVSRPQRLPIGRVAEARAPVPSPLLKDRLGLPGLALTDTCFSMWREKDQSSALLPC